MQAYSIKSGLTAKTGAFLPLIPPPAIVPAAPKTTVLLPRNHGSAIDDAWAARIVDRMFDEIEPSAAACLNKFDAILATIHDIGHNARAILKFRARIRAAADTTLIDMRITEARRGSFYADHYVIDHVTDAKTGAKNRRFTIYRLYVTVEKRAIHVEDLGIIGLSHHACVRLLQRANLRTHTELCEAITNLWPSVVCASLITEGCRERGRRWYFPIAVGNDKNMVAIFAARETIPSPRFSLVTVLTPGMEIPEPQRAAVDTVAALMSRHEIPQSGVAEIERALRTHE